MKILIDGYNLGMERGTGVSTYARNLSFALGALGHDVGILYGKPISDSDNPIIREICFFDSAQMNSPLWIRKLHAIFDATKFPLLFRSLPVSLSGTVVTDSIRSNFPFFNSLHNASNIFNYSQNRFRLWRKISKLKSDFSPEITHWTYPLPIFTSRPSRNIYTLHDLVPLRLPYTTLENKIMYFDLCRKIVKSADHIVTVSESSRRDIINILGVHPEFVTNTYQSVAIPDKYKLKSEDIIRRELQSGFGLAVGQYFLFFGNIEPKKYWSCN
jgi:glycosyltransferase involved in cell wall biosynthesis